MAVPPGPTCGRGASLEPILSLIPPEVSPMPRPAGPTRHVPTPRLAIAGVLGVLFGALLVAASTPLSALAATPRLHPIKNARIVTSPGHVIARGNVIMRDGIVVAVGPDAAIPADARVWDRSEGNTP